MGISPNPEFEVAVNKLCELTGKIVVKELLKEAMALGAEQARQLCCEYPNTQRTNATNNWEVGKRVVAYLERRKLQL